MVYLVLLAALLLLALKGYSGKRVSLLVRHTADNFLFNLLRMLFCVLIGWITVYCGGGAEHLFISGKMLWICLLSGVSNVAFLVGWMLSVQKNPMVTVDVTLTVGSLIPALLCALLFAEPILPQKLFGFVLIVIASVILSGYNQGEGKGGAAGYVCLALALLGDGMMGFSQQLFIKFCYAGGSFAHGRVYPLSVFHFYTYVFAAVALALLLLVWRCRLPSAKNKAPRPRGTYQKALPHIALMALCLFAATYLQTLATGSMGMSSQVLYPIIKGGCLITVNITAMLFFGEKITRRSVCGSLVAMAGIVVMSVL